MNIKIKSSGVYCPFGNDYEKYYATLKKQLVAEDEQLFTERIPGHEYLQWELPGEGWKSLGVADPLLDQEIRAEYIRRQQLVCNKFGSNQEMALKILAVPDDNYVYYKIDDSGKIQIKLTAWGYRYPERIDGGPSIGSVTGQVEKEYVLICIMYADKPMSNKAFALNKILPRKTNEEGVYKIGELPIGYQFDLDVDNTHRHITVEKGCGEICIDMTQYVLIEVKVYRDGMPYAGVHVIVSYMRQQRELTCDGNGMTSVRLPLSLDGENCIVTVEDEVQQRPLVGGVENFVFQLVSPSPVPEPDPVPEPIPDPLPVPDPLPDPTPLPDSDPDPVPEPIPDPVPVPDPIPDPDPVPTPIPEPETDNSRWGCLLTGLLALLIVVLLYSTFFLCMELLGA